VRATADQRGIEIVLHEPSPPVAVLGDRRQLVSAMHALLENAITYSYDNSKVVVTGAVQRFNPNLSHPSIAGNLVDEGDDVLGHDPITGEYPAVVAEAGMMPGAGNTDAGNTDAGNTDAGNTDAGHTRARHSRRGDTRRRDADDGDADGGNADGADTGEIEATTSTRAPAAGRVDPVFTPEILDQYAPLGQAAPGASAATGTTAPSMPVPPVVTAEGDAAGTGPADSSAAIPPNWRIEERDNVRLSVQDHGVGIPARDLDRIFERFYRVDHGRSRDTGGTGLGLSIVRHVANNHQGWVDVESREGEGSTFTLVLPIQAERLA
jgi:Histidine kinase-, DNA gyrase B-, and HSP90-like ATPase